MGLRILVTGGAGFKGGHLVEHWASVGHEITILNTYSAESLNNSALFADRVSVVWGSVTDQEIVDKTVRGHDLVVHMAARVNVDESIENPTRFPTVNILGTLNVLEAVRRTGARMIYVSSCEVYGYAAASPIAEHAELRPHSPYAASKAAADRICFSYYQTYGLDVTIMRPCSIYGERQKTGKGGAVIPIFASQALAGKPLTIFGDGSQRREYMHVMDVIGAFDLVLCNSDLAGVVLNLGTGETPSIREIAEFISAKFGVPIKQEPPRAGEVPGFALDSTLARSLKFNPSKVDPIIKTARGLN